LIIADVKKQSLATIQEIEIVMTDMIHFDQLDDK